MRLLIAILTFSFCLGKININNSDIELMRDIPIDNIKINAIIDYIDYSNGIDNIYQLLEIEEINSTHNFIKNISEKYNNFQVLYGGSLNTNNFKEILNLPNVNGGLLGGSSLKIDDFNKIIAI